MSIPNDLSPQWDSSLPLRHALSRSERMGVAAIPDARVMSWIRGKLLLATGLYVAALLWAYATIVVPEYGYEGFALRWPSTVQMAWLITLVLLPVSFLPSSSWRPSVLVVWWLYLTVYIPATLVPALSLSLLPGRLLPLQFSLLLCLGVIAFASSTRKLLAVRQMVVSPTLFWPVFLTMWIICLAIIIALGRFSALMSNIASLFEGANEYAIRGKYGDLLVEVPLLGYLTGQVSNAIHPFLIAFGLRYRSMGCLIAGIVGQIIIFSLTGFKSVLSSIVFLALLALFVLRPRRSFGLVLTSGLMIALLASTVIDRATDSVFLTSLITRRTVLITGLLTGFYFEHYSQVSPVGLGIHSSLFRDERVLSPPNEIGFAYFGDLNVNANANLWAMGYAELGLPGMFLYTIFTAFLIWIYDSIAAGRDPTMAVLLLAMPAATVSNTLPSTTMITHGGLAVALLLYLAPTPNEAEESHPSSTGGTPI